MARRIVSLKGSQPQFSAAPLSSASPVPITSIHSIVSDRHTITLGTASTQPMEFGAKSTSQPGDSNSSTDDTYLRHDTYFFEDGNITFLVDGTLYCVHRYFFSRDSAYFNHKLTRLGVRDHESLHTIISLDDVERKDFEAFLSVIYPRNFDEHDLSYEQWRSVLHLSSLWGFNSLRNLALKTIEPPNACERLLLARKYDVGDWVLPALSALCERRPPLSLEEARQMSIEDVVVVATVREEVRDNKFPVNTARISRRIEAAQLRMLGRCHEASDDDSLVDLGKDVAEKRPRKDTLNQAVTGPNVEGNSYDRTEKEAVATGPPENADVRGGHRSEHSAGTTAETKEEKIFRTYDQPSTPNATSEDGLPRPVNRRKKKGGSWASGLGGDAVTRQDQVSVMAKSETVPGEAQHATGTTSGESGMQEVIGEEKPTHPSKGWPTSTQGSLFPPAAFLGNPFAR